MIQLKVHIKLVDSSPNISSEAKYIPIYLQIPAWQTLTNKNINNRMLGPTKTHVISELCFVSNETIWKPKPSKHEIPDIQLQSAPSLYSTSDSRSGRSRTREYRDVRQDSSPTHNVCACTMIIYKPRTIAIEERSPSMNKLMLNFAANGADYFQMYLC